MKCPSWIWEYRAMREAAGAGIDPVKVLAGWKTKPFVHARWRVWRELSRAGYSYGSIATVSGFHHSVVMHACKPEMRAKRLDYVKKYSAREAS